MLSSGLSRRGGSFRVALAPAVLAGVLTCCAGWSCANRQAPRLQGVILFWREDPFPSIWSMRPDGTELRRIVRNRQNAKRPRLSPDGEWVAFDGTPPGEPPLSDFDLQLVRVDGTELRTVTHTDDWDVDAQWSPDGKWLAFTRSPPSPSGCTSSAVWIVRPDGTDARKVAAGCEARWSPDGTKLVYAAESKTYEWALNVVGIDGRRLRTLHTSGAVETPAGWSPNGRQILFSRIADEEGRNAAVLVMNADGTGIRTLARGTAGCWSPDGSEILYASSTAPLVIMRADGTHKRRIPAPPAESPDWR